jgi:hypothetical protein
MGYNRSWVHFISISEQQEQSLRESPLSRDLDPDPAPPSAFEKAPNRPSRTARCVITVNCSVPNIDEELNVCFYLLVQV